VGEGAREEALATLARTGLIDDRRFAESRARALAARGAGDTLIRHDLASAGITRDLVEDAVDELEPETERARRIVAQRGASAKSARYLAGKGFSEDVVRAAVAHGHDEPLG
jgi:regulatory protein